MAVAVVASRLALVATSRCGSQLISAAAVAVVASRLALVATSRLALVAMAADLRSV